MQANVNIFLNERQYGEMLVSLPGEPYVVLPMSARVSCVKSRHYTRGLSGDSP